jgi:hypothetical protein
MFVSPEVTPKHELEELATQFSELNVSAVETCLAFLKTTALVYAALDTHLALLVRSFMRRSHVLVLQSPSNRLTDIQVLVPKILAIVDTAPKGAATVVSE